MLCRTVEQSDGSFFLLAPDDLTEEELAKLVVNDYGGLLPSNRKPISESPEVDTTNGELAVLLCRAFRAVASSASIIVTDWRDPPESQRDCVGAERIPIELADQNLFRLTEPVGENALQNVIDWFDRNGLICALTSGLEIDDQLTQQDLESAIRENLVMFSHSACDGESHLIWLRGDLQIAEVTAEI